jgi:hypothetical protein
MGRKESPFPLEGRIRSAYCAVKRVGEVSELSTTEWGSIPKLNRKVSLPVLCILFSFFATQPIVEAFVELILLKI